MKLNTVSYILFILIISVITLNAGATIAEPGVTARSSGDNVMVSWQTLQENGVKHFAIERKTQGGTFVEVGVLQPESDKFYEFLDETAYKVSGTIYLYRVAIVDNNGNVTHSNEVTVLHDNISSVKKTWGSIKALFR